MSEDWAESGDMAEHASAAGGISPDQASQSSAPTTRFAPSPTGFLHIGGARTALFNWLFARAHGGRFLLRIEDTDRARSTPEATEAIFEGMRWLELDWDGEAVSQFSRIERHRAAANALLDTGGAYRCYATKEEIDAARAEADASGKPTLFQSPWRDRDPSDAPADKPFVVRLKAPRSGETEIEDAVQGPVAWRNETLDDLILLRSDGTPTYMLAVVVDDHEMGVTHVIRGDDHLTNAARQSLIFRALGWPAPVFAHIPLIHGADGAKLSKRHGALGVDAYRNLGMLPEGVRNYLARLSWSHGDAEIFSTEEAVSWFSLEGVGRSAARFDLAKLEHVNSQHMKRAAPTRLLTQLDVLSAAQGTPAIVGAARERLACAADAVKERAKTLLEFRDMAYFATAQRPLNYDEKALSALDAAGVARLRAVRPQLAALETWERSALEAAMARAAETLEVKLGKVAQPLRAALTARGASPGVFDVMLVLGQKETLARIDDRLE